MLPIAFLAAAASMGLAPNSTLYSDSRPPPVFQHDATVTLQLSSPSLLQKTCNSMFGAPPAGMQTNACEADDRLIMPNPCSFPDSDRYAHLLCHELGHANGWPKTHGDFPEAGAQGAATAKADGPVGDAKAS